MFHKHSNDEEKLNSWLAGEWILKEGISSYEMCNMCINV